MSISLQSHLESLLPYHTALLQTIPPLLSTVTRIAQALRSQAVSTAGSANAFGDAQLNVDLTAERIIRDTVASECPAIVCLSSEEDPVERAINTSTSADDHGGVKEAYTLAFDPLDGSSIIDTNWTVGTIMGVWEGMTALRQAPAIKQVAAILGVYGPRVTAIVALRVPARTVDGGSDATAVQACFEATLGEDGAWGVSKTEIQLDDAHALAGRKTKYFAPANLRAAAEDAGYERLITHYIKEKYTLRYSGGLVPDVVHTLVKGHGVFVSPTGEKSKAKLRRLYETLPIALIMECCGGVAVNPADGKSVLGTTILDEDERSGIVCGTKEEVKKAMSFLAQAS